MAEEMVEDGKSKKRVRKIWVLIGVLNRWRNVGQWVP